ncbi:MAG: SBBP repeat-containing protein [Myxococcota bacterium]
MVRNGAIGVALAALLLTSACGTPSNGDPSGPDGSDFPLQFGSDGYDGVSSMKLDGEGNLRLAGATEGTLGEESNGGLDAYVRTVAPDGSVNATDQFGTAESDSAADLDVAADGRTVVAGTTEGDLAGTNQGVGDAFVRVIDPAGDTQWVDQFGTSADDDATGVAFAGNGDVVVAGVTDGDLAGSNAGGSDVFVRRYDADGQAVAWTDQFGSDENDFNVGVTTDPSGNVIVIASVLGDVEGHRGESDGLVRKYDPTGNVAWTLQFGTPANDYVYAVATDEDGNVYIGGRTSAALGEELLGGSDAILLKLAPDATAQWTRQFGTEASDRVTAIAAEGGEVVVAGQTDGDLEGAAAGEGDVFVRRYDDDGNELGTVQFGTPEEDWAFGVALDDAGRVLVAGDTEGSLGGENAGDYDAFVHRVNP